MTITLEEKIAAVEQAIAREDEWVRGNRIIPALEAVLADLRAMRELRLEGIDQANMKEAIEGVCDTAHRAGAEEMRSRCVQFAGRLAAEASSRGDTQLHEAYHRMAVAMDKFEAE